MLADDAGTVGSQRADITPAFASPQATPQQAAFNRTGSDATMLSMSTATIAIRYCE